MPSRVPGASSSSAARPFSGSFHNVGLCLEVHDLLISKYFAGRDKDHEFCSAVVEAGLVDHDQLMQRLADTEMDGDTRQRVTDRIAADFAARQHMGSGKS